MEGGGGVNVVGISLNLLFAFSKTPTVYNTHTRVCVCEFSVLISSALKKNVNE